MSDPRYRAGVRQGILASYRPGTWPDAIPRYAERAGGQPLASCALCPPTSAPSVRTTFVRYGGTPMCKRHAQAAQGWDLGADGPACSWPGSNLNRQAAAEVSPFAAALARQEATR